MTFREFKENIISSLKEKVAIALEAKKQEVASSMFEAKDDGEEYREFFRSALKKFGVKSPDELEGKKKKEFYDYVDKNWTSDKEEAGIEEGKFYPIKWDLKVMVDGTERSFQTDVEDEKKAKEQALATYKKKGAEKVFIKSIKKIKY